MPKEAENEDWGEARLAPRSRVVRWERSGSGAWSFEPVVVPGYEEEKERDCDSWTGAALVVTI